VKEKEKGELKNESQSLLKRESKRKERKWLNKIKIGKE
jgi:hypothetical protein